MTFTVTPQPFNVPPRVRIDVSSDDVSKPFTSLTVSRDGKPLREQPFVGSSSAVLFDYEAPFGASVTYSATGVTSGTGVLYSTAWPNLTGWTTVSGSPAVSDGKFVSSDFDASVKRNVTLPLEGRLQLAAPIGAGAGFATASLQLGPGLRVHKTGGGGPAVKRYVTFGGVVQQVTHTASEMTVQWGPSGATVTTSSGSWSIPGTFDNSTSEVTATVSGSNVPGFTISALGSPASFSATASTYLDVRETWLIHPSKPGLSVPIYNHESSDGLRWIEASSGDQKSSASVATIHRPVGRRKAVVITSGPRQADEWTLVVESLTIEAKNSLRAIVDDQTPLLLRSPADVVMDLPDDWYSVGDLTVARVEVPVITQRTLTTMPLIPVDEPVVRVGALWTWGDVLLRYATWADVMAAYDTWLDLQAGPEF
jgi:hypothetical protein